MTNLIPRIEFIIQSLFRKQSYCPHCHSRNLIDVTNKYFFVKINKCESCYVYFTSPIYKPLLVSNLYEQLYSAEGYTTLVPSRNELEQLINSNFDLSDKYFQKRIELIKAYCERNKMLEIGSSWGYFLYQAHQQGFDTTGVEISKKRRLFGIKNLGVDIVDSIQKLEQESFDIVYTAHTLEHFTDISTIFTDIYSILKSKGKLFIEVPNFDWEKFGQKSLHHVGAVHPLGFSSEFFQKNLPKYGFNLLGFFDSWNEFPNNPVAKSQSEVIIVVAEKD